MLTGWEPMAFEFKLRIKSAFIYYDTMYYSREPTPTLFPPPARMMPHILH